MVRIVFGIAAISAFLFVVSDLRADEVDAISLPPVALAPGGLPPADMIPTVLTAEQIDDCIRENFPDKNSRQFLSFKVTDRSGLTDESSLEAFWKRYPDGYWRLLARFLGPLNVRGTAVLMHERDYGTDIFVYLPDLHRVRRINKRAMHGSIAGTDLTYEDWERLQGLAKDSELKRLPDSEIEGRPVYVLEGRSAYADDTSYTRILSWVDRKTCIVLRSEIYEKGDRLRKVVTVPANAIWPESHGWFARYIRVEDRRAGSQTEVFVEEIAVDEPLADKYFTQVELESKSR